MPVSLVIEICSSIPTPEPTDVHSRNQAKFNIHAGETPIDPKVVGVHTKDKGPRFKSLGVIECMMAH